MTLSEAEAHPGVNLPVGSGLPRRLLKRIIARFTRFLVHHQIPFYSEVGAALRDELAVQAGLRSELEALTSRLEGQFAERQSRDEEIWAALSSGSDRLESQGREFWEAIAAQATHFESTGSDLWAAISAQAAHFDASGADLWSAIEAQTKQVDESAADLWSVINDRWEALIEVRGRLDNLGLAIGRNQEYAEQQTTALKLHVDLMQRQAFARHHEGVGELRTELVEMSLKLADLRQRMDAGASELRRRQAIVDTLLDGVRKSLPEPVSRDALAKLPGAMELMYPAFEDIFRGPSRAVGELLSEYLPDVLALDRQGPVVDLGSGRGEWLEILAEAGVDAYGVDMSQDFVDKCQERGLKVVLGDACDHLAGLVERSVSAVTAFHLIEHVGIDRLIQLIDLAVRALEPGGLLIFETPNPDNLVVGSSSFYLDPSHRRPIPPALLAFLLEARGLADVELRLLHPNSTGNLAPPLPNAPWSDDLAPLMEALNARLFGPQDYAVIGRRL